MYHFVSAYLCLHWLARKRKSCMEQIGSTSEKDEWRWTREWKPYKMALGKRQLTLSSCQDRCSTKWLWDFRLFYHIMNALVWSFSKYLWIKTGDRRYHFVEPWFMDRPFCRMETVYHNHFVEQMASPLQNGPLRPHPGNGNRDICSSQLGLTRSIQSSLI